MKKASFVLLFIGLFFVATKAQQLEKSMYRAEAGLIGFWVNNESRLAEKITLHSEVGFNGLIFGGAAYDDEVNFFLQPSITITPRYYYNLARRSEKGKNVANNAANYLGFQFQFSPNEPLISNNNNLGVYSSIALLPSWGFRRNLGSNFTFETGVSLGYAYYLKEDFGLENEGFLTFGLRLRFGYIFFKK